MFKKLSSEWRKITWAPKKEIATSSVAIIFFAGLLLLYLTGVDFALGEISRKVVTFFD